MRAFVVFLVLSGCGPTGPCEDAVQAFCRAALRCHVVDSNGFTSCVDENRKRLAQLKVTPTECEAARADAESASCCRVAKTYGQAVTCTE